MHPNITFWTKMIFF